MACCCSSGPCAGCDSFRDTITVEILRWNNSTASPLCGTYVLNRVGNDPTYEYRELGGSTACDAALEKIYVQVQGTACVPCGSGYNLGMYAYAEYASGDCCGFASDARIPIGSGFQYNCLHVMSNKQLCGNGYFFTEKWPCSNVSWTAAEFLANSRECNKFSCFGTFFAFESSAWKLSP